MEREKRRISRKRDRRRTRNGQIFVDQEMKKRERRNGRGTGTETKSGQIYKDQDKNETKETGTEGEALSKEQRADGSLKIQV